jgi:hypothetical protein
MYNTDVTLCQRRCVSGVISILTQRHRNATFDIEIILTK